MSVRDDAIAIWKAGVAAVNSETLVQAAVLAHGSRLIVGGREYTAGQIDRITIVGAGKAGAGMARGLLNALDSLSPAVPIFGWVNVPADCVAVLPGIHLHPGRPAGVNEPTLAAVEGTQQQLSLLQSVTSRSLTFVLLSGGGSALLCAPIPGVTLEEKLAVSRGLASRGATIHELNTVRKRLSMVKGGGLARAIPAGDVVVLVISDVPGSPLDIIASGPTVTDSSDQTAARRVLEKFFPGQDVALVPESVWVAVDRPLPTPSCLADQERVHHVVVGSNETAVIAAKAAAVHLGYTTTAIGFDRAGVARDIGVELAEAALRLPATGKYCLVDGGEPVVKLVPTSLPRRGGRNQELVLAAAQRLLVAGDAGVCRNIAILSGGTDGEDGPTDAAGAFCDAQVLLASQSAGLSPVSFLAINNSYQFFEQAGGLLKTGPTHTNVMDLRVCLSDHPAP